MRKKEIKKQSWKAGNMLYPLPVVMVSCKGQDGTDNIITVAWTGTICTNPAMVYISVRPERHSYQMIKDTGEFVINLTTESLAKATDYCGVRSGREVDKFEEMQLSKESAELVNVAMIKESPVNIECKVTEIKELGSHHMFLAEVLRVHVDERLLDDTGKLDLSRGDLLAYSHGEYFSLGECVGTFGYSVKKNKSHRKKNNFKKRGAEAIRKKKK